MPTPPPPVPSAPAAAAGGWGTTLSRAAGWATEEGVTLPDRSGGRTLQEVSRVMARFGSCTDPDTWGRAAARALAEAGICLADLAALVPNLRAWGGPAALAFAVDEAAARLREPAERYPDLDVRDALGWALVDADAARGLTLSRWTWHTIDPWASVRLTDAGWAFAAAGLTPAEARAGLDTGAVSAEQACTLARLRGAPLPA